MPFSFHRGEKEAYESQGFTSSPTDKSYSAIAPGFLSLSSAVIFW